MTSWLFGISPRAQVYRCKRHFLEGLFMPTNVTTTGVRSGSIFSWIRGLRLSLGRSSMSWIIRCRIVHRRRSVYDLLANQQLRSGGGRQVANVQHQDRVPSGSRAKTPIPLISIVSFAYRAS